MARYVHKFEGEVQGGRVVLDNPVAFAAECRPFEGKRVTLSLAPFRKPKSDRQNRYYRGVVVQRFAEYWGLSNEQAHRALSFEHLKVIPEKAGQPTYIRSTSLAEWDTAEWEDYMVFLRRWGAEEFGLNIEAPNEVDFSQIRNVW